MIGTTVGSYRIISKLSVGGMGTVYRAEHTLIGKLAAVKVLNAELCTNEEMVQRFLNEARATTTIKHPGIVEVFDFGHMPSGNAYLTMEFLEGMSLARRCKMRGKMSEGEAAMLLRAVCSALSAAHAKGIIHRDLKPDNIFLVTDPETATGERPKLLDFGIAKLTEVGLAGATKTGSVMGTPTYMSPEQCSGSGVIDHRADLYSLGCVLYEIITGRPPFTNLGPGELIGAHLYMTPESPRTYLPEISAETEALIMALLAKLPSDRPADARELAQRLTEIAQLQGWLTQTSPTGTTARSLEALSPAASLPTTVDLPSGSDLTVPSVPSMPAMTGVDNPRRSRTRLGLAMAAAAVIAGGAVAIFQLRFSHHRSSSQAEAAPPASAHAPRPSAAVTPARPAPTPVTNAAPAIPPPPVPPLTVEPVIETAKATAPSQKPAKLPARPQARPLPPTPTPTPSPADPPPAPPPTPPPLLETDL
ncbi:MAG: serine/threonine protein kinase [Myxococcales bacterium]|nr:serine/threonine protein kinase [Myxococcales bacterium]